jgi:hypothetical protein
VLMRTSPGPPKVMQNGCGARSCRPRPVVAERGGYELPEGLLHPLIESAPKRGRAAVRGGAHHARRAAFEIFEHGFEAGLCGAGLVAVEEGVVGMVIVAEVFRCRPLEVQNRLQVADEGAEVAIGACPPPGRLRKGGCARYFGHQE